MPIDQSNGVVPPDYTRSVERSDGELGELRHRQPCRYSATRESTDEVLVRTICEMAERCVEGPRLRADEIIREIELGRLRSSCSESQRLVLMRDGEEVGLQLHRSVAPDECASKSRVECHTR